MSEISGARREPGAMGATSGPLAPSALLDTVRALSEGIGPRPSTSDRERAASEYVAGRLRACGWEVEVEPFRSVTSFSWAYGTFFLAFVLAALLLPSVPLAACALAWLALVAFALESSGIETLTRVLPRRESQNVVARYARAGGSREADRAPRVVLSAHVDSARSALLWHPRLVGTFRALLLLAIGAMLALAVLATVALFTRPMWLLLAAGAAGAYLALVMLALLDRELRWQVTPGANDNASGVAALLGLAETLAREPDAASEVWVVATGCEEAGTVGMLRFVRSHRPAFDRKLTVFVNFDNLGAGRPAAITAEGILLPLRSDRASLTAARAFADAHPELGISLRPYHILTTDAVIPLTLGYRAMSIMAFDARGNLPNWHWHTDTVDRVDAQTLASAAALGLAVTRAALADRGD